MQSESKEQKHLVISLRGGDKEAFTTLYRSHWPKVFNFSQLYLSSVSEAEEVVQEVFIKLWEVREFLNVDENFEGFLFIITRNIIFNHQRRSFNEQAYKMTLLDCSNQEEYDIEEEMEALELQACIQKLVDELPPRQQEVFRLSREKHLSYKEIALRLSISEKTVERHINEALKYLRKNILLFTLFLS